MPMHRVELNGFYRGFRFRVVIDGKDVACTRVESYPNSLRIFAPHRRGDAMLHERFYNAKRVEIVLFERGAEISDDPSVVSRGSRVITLDVKEVSPIPVQLDAVSLDDALDGLDIEFSRVQVTEA